MKKIKNILEAVGFFGSFALMGWSLTWSERNQFVYGWLIVIAMFVGAYVYYRYFLGMKDTGGDYANNNDNVKSEFYDYM